MHKIINKRRAARAIKSGFTLIEMLIVVLIVAILAAIALPQYNTSVERSKMAEAVTLVKQIAEAVQRNYLATGEYNLTDLRACDITIPGEIHGEGSYIETNNFEYTVDGGSRNVIYAIRRPFWQTYYISIISPNPKIFCTYRATATDIQKKLCTQINSAGTI